MPAPHTVAAEAVHKVLAVAGVHSAGSLVVVRAVHIAFDSVGSERGFAGFVVVVLVFVAAVRPIVVPETMRMT